MVVRLISAAPSSRRARLTAPGAILAILLLTACTKPQSPQPTAGIKVYQRIASLAPSNTELIYSLGLQDRLVAVCNQCDYPEVVKKKPKIGSFVSVDLERLALIHPQGTFLVDGQEALAANIRSHAVAAVVLSNKTVADVAANLRTIGRMTAESQHAETVARTFEDRVSQLRLLTVAQKTRPRVFFCVWPDPLTTVGSASYLNDAITICGGTNIAGNLRAAYPHFSSEKLLLEQPDQIILPKEAQTATFLRRSPWTSLKAVQNNRVYFLPPRDQDRLSRPTIRLEEGLVWLASKIHPELVDAITKQMHTWQDIHTAEHSD